jgi:hypothetical protein
MPTNIRLAMTGKRAYNARELITAVKGFYNTGVLFTIFHFLRNLRMGIIS